MVGEGQLFITGIRPGSFEDASSSIPERPAGGSLDVTVDVTECWAMSAAPLAGIAM